VEVEPQVQALSDGGSARCRGVVEHRAHSELVVGSRARFRAGRRPRAGRQPKAGTGLAGGGCGLLLVPRFGHCSPASGVPMLGGGQANPACSSGALGATSRGPGWGAGAPRPRGLEQGCRTIAMGWGRPPTPQPLALPGLHGDGGTLKA